MSPTPDKQEDKLSLFITIRWILSKIQRLQTPNQRLSIITNSSPPHQIQHYHSSQIQKLKNNTLFSTLTTLLTLAQIKWPPQPPPLQPLHHSSAPASAKFNPIPVGSKPDLASERRKSHQRNHRDQVPVR